MGRCGMSPEWNLDRIGEKVVRRVEMSGAFAERIEALADEWRLSEEMILLILLSAGLSDPGLDRLMDLARRVIVACGE